MFESKILKNFFEEHHRHFKKRAYTTLQCLCGKHPLHSEHGQWLKRQGDQKPSVPENPDLQKYTPGD